MMLEETEDFLFSILQLMWGKFSISPLISAVIIAKFGWKSAFITAGFGVLLGVAILNFGLLKYPKLGKPINPAHISYILFIPLLVAGTALFYFLVKHIELANFFLFTSSGCLIFYIIKQSIHLSSLIILCY